MLRIPVIAVLLAAGSLAAPSAGRADPSEAPPAAAVSEPSFEADIAPLGDDLWGRMQGTSWREGCPLGREGLRQIDLAHWGLDGEVHRGRLVVAASAAEDLVAVFRRLFEARFPIERIAPVSEYGGDDDASMEANNTSAFNCRAVAGKRRLSEHAHGLAVDLNPKLNPFVQGARVAPESGRPWVDRGEVRPGMIVDGDAVVRAFDSIGWKWGGRWRRAKDYQHFSKSGR